MDLATQKRIDRIYTIWGIILLIWALYRAFLKLPEGVDELIVKPLLFVVPILWYVVKRERRMLSTVGIARGKFSRDLVLGVGFGIIFMIEAILAHKGKYGTITWLPVGITGLGVLSSLLMAFATSFSEEFLVRGFIYSRLKELYHNEMKALGVSTLMYFFLLTPAIFLVTRLTGANLLIFLGTNVVLSFANTMIFNETKTITVPVLIHAFWNIAVMWYL